MSTPVLKIYNTLTRTKEEFRPLDPANVRMYVCGPTVYDFAHIGNARPLIVFDVLYRLLRHLAKQGAWDGDKGETKVTYVRNITDVDDKINARAAERGITIRELTDQTYAIFKKDVEALGCLPPTFEPRATDYIDAMIEIIQRLIDQGYAYAVENSNEHPEANGHVLFDVRKMLDYGRLSRRSLDELLAGARVDVAPYKRGEMDFVLWKPSFGTDPGWPSPWGWGRPGWHIECSAMSWKHLGEEFDIHGGGLDLIFPHHENEIAQTRCAFGHDLMARYWMHNGFLQVEGEKMSKSLGNFVTIHELLHTEKFGGRKWPGEVLRLAMLRTHYRQPIDWTVKALEEAEKTLFRWLRNLDRILGEDLLGAAYLPLSNPRQQLLYELSDDLNTPAALSGLGVASGLINPNADASDQYVREEAFQLVEDLKLLGIISSFTVATLLKAAKGLDRELNPELQGTVESLIAARLAARAAKNWTESDRIRDELAAMGVALKDNKDGTTTWEVKR